MSTAIDHFSRKFLARSVVFLRFDTITFELNDLRGRYCSAWPNLGQLVVQVIAQSSGSYEVNFSSFLPKRKR